MKLSNDILQNCLGMQVHSIRGDVKTTPTYINGVGNNASRDAFLFYNIETRQGFESGVIYDYVIPSEIEIYINDETDDAINLETWLLNTFYDDYHALDAAVGLVIDNPITSKKNDVLVINKITYHPLHGYHVYTSQLDYQLVYKDIYAAMQEITVDGICLRDVLRKLK